MLLKTSHNNHEEVVFMNGLLDSVFWDCLYLRYFTHSGYFIGSTLLLLYIILIIIVVFVREACTQLFEIRQHFDGFFWRVWVLVCFCGGNIRGVNNSEKIP